MAKTFIFGHKSPDTDSVCASISLSYLKNQLGFDTEPRVLGDLNKETNFVLSYFKFPEPKFLNDVKVQIKNMKYNKKAMINENASIFETYEKINEFDVTGLPLVDNKNKLTGYCNVKEIAKYLIDGDITQLDTSYENILKTLNGKSILKFNDEIRGHVLAATFRSVTFIDRVDLNNNDILIVGDRYKILEYSVKTPVKLLILINNFTLPDELLEIAKQNKVNVISVPMGSFKCANMVKLCNYIKLININPNPITFDDFDYRDDFIKISTKYGHTNYPIIDKDNKCVGMLKLVDQNTYDKAKVILVDHNQASQSVDGIDEADVLEVIDHHNLGTIGTNTPINFRSMPVGCTCTIIYYLFKESNVEIPRNIAGLMLSAILSDTLLLNSPTTTNDDIRIANELAKIAQVDINQYGTKMFKEGSSVKGMTPTEIIHQDRKSFNYNDANINISQITTLDIDNVINIKEDIIGALNSMCDLGNYKISLLFVTDIINKGSYLFYNDSSKDIVSEAYSINDIRQGVYMDGVVSRKKQMLPNLLEVIERRG